MRVCLKGPVDQLMSATVRKASFVIDSFTVVILPMRKLREMGLL